MINARKKSITMPRQLGKLYDFVRENKFSKTLIRYVDWPLLLIVLALSLYGVLVIFCATGTPVLDESLSVLAKIRQQSFTYPRLQLIWMVAGVFVLAATVYFDYDLFARFSTAIYWANIALLVIVLGGAKLRGNMAGWFQWGDGRTFQPSEIAKVAIIIALAKQFSGRKHPINTIAELIPSMAYIALPLMLIVAQPDVGTALVYIVIYTALLFVSGTNRKLLIGLVCIVVVLAVPAWYLLSSSESFRFARIQVWLDPSYDATGTGAGMQTQNARLAVSMGGVWGRGMFAEGNFAALNYIPDDHTDFIFAIVCETFGLVGAGFMVILFVLLLMRLISLARKAQDAFGSYMIIGIAAMMFFHIFENIAMVIGLMPVTGIPLPFISYGGSNYLTNIISVGLVINVTMRSRARTRKQKNRIIEPAKL